MSVVYTPNLSNEIFFKENKLPPTDGVYVTPGDVARLVQQRHRDPRRAAPGLHRQRHAAALGANLTHSFGSQVEMDVSTDDGGTWTRAPRRQRA